MKRLKKLFAFLIIVSMLITVLGGCGGETADDNQTDSVAQKTAAAQFPHKRLQSVTVYDKEEGTTETYDVEWKDDGCYFRTDDYGEDIDYYFYLDDETNIFHVAGTAYESSEPEQVDFPVYQFDDEGKIIKLWNIHFDSAEIDVTYDENGLPAFAGYDPSVDVILDEYTFDFEKRDLEYKFGGGGSQDEYGNQETTDAYEINALNEYGDPLDSRSRFVKKYNGELVSDETKVDDHIKYTYDENGNLIRFETYHSVKTFTYSDETVHHPWERLPIYMYTERYDEFGVIYIYPFLWYVK